MRRAVSALVAAGALVALAAPATAAAATCPELPTKRAFAVFGDLADYSLAPNGGLESGTTGWTLSRAYVVYGNEPFFLNLSGARKSLRVESGGRAATGSFCLGAEHPPFRFVTRQPWGDDPPSLRVS